MSLIEVAPVETAIFGKTFAAFDALEETLGSEGFALYAEQIAAVRKAVEKAAAAQIRRSSSQRPSMTR